MLMSPNRPRRDYTFLHALGGYHIGEALDYAQSAEDEHRPEPPSRPPAHRKGVFGRNLFAPIRRLLQWLSHPRPLRKD